MRFSFRFSTENGTLAELLKNSKSSVTAVFISWRMSSWNRQSTSVRNRKTVWKKRRHLDCLKCVVLSSENSNSKHSLISSFSATYNSINNWETIVNTAWCLIHSIFISLNNILELNITISTKTLTLCLHCTWTWDQKKNSLCSEAYAVWRLTCKAG